MIPYKHAQKVATPRAFAGLVPNERKRFGALGRQTYCDDPGQARAVASPNFFGYNWEKLSNDTGREHGEKNGQNRIA